MLEFMEEATVECLINAETRSWNVEMIDGIFIPQEAELIKKIPLSRCEADDSLFWPWSPNGQYSCKLGYRFLREEEDFNRLEEPPDYEKGLWKAVWALEIPNKVKHLLWRACKNSIPTKWNLARRKTITDPSCDRCAGGCEDFLHAVWKCADLDGVWGELELWGFRARVSFQCFGELMAWIIKNNRTPELFAMFFWSIWTQRNQLRTQQPYCPLSQLSQLAKDRFYEFKASHPAALPRRGQQQTTWSPPAQNAFKINYDGALFPDTNRSGIGVVIHNGDGQVIASLAQPLNQTFKAVEIEALAASRALELAADIGLNEVILEGDSMVVPQALKSKDLGLAAYGLLIRDALSFAGIFSEVSYSHTKREGNNVAHGLAN
ncbi:hypothetical protein SO802_012112 [Lithocarpus litseifolius]|uniref:RNase H type-1 domain-containing protein n=1 Tax=Lithocarpus litseifolius TaxID=425828 RepID=A0AAW2D795_9ROSI